MRILVTGSSGQIGTNLALRLLEDGHEVFGVDKRPNAWVGNAFPTLLQDLAGHYSAFHGGINGVAFLSQVNQLYRRQFRHAMSPR